MTTDKGLWQSAWLGDGLDEFLGWWWCCRQEETDKDGSVAMDFSSDHELRAEEIGMVEGKEKRKAGGTVFI